MTDYDSPWKEILDAYFPEFMAFFFPEAYQDIDWSRGYESLDKELQQIVRDAELGRRLADKLMKVWRKNGEEQIVLVHAEVQDDRETAFDKRLYVYNYRLFDRYDRPVVSLAVLSDPSPDWRPNSFGYSLWGCRVGIEFPVVKRRDFQNQWEELEQSDNPFATVVMAHLKTQATKGQPEDRLHWKSYLVRRLYERGYSRKAILELFRFIDWVLVLPEGLEERFQVEFERFQAEKKMPYITSIERRGIQKAEALLLKSLLLQRFGSLPEWAEQRLEKADQETLEAWTRRLLDAQQLNDIFDS